MAQKYALNPAYAGLESTLSITGAFRAQWQELPGAPTTNMIQAHLPLYYLRGAGGIKIEQESFGVEKNIRASLSYNYVKETPIGLFSVGIGLGFVQKSLDGAALRTPQGRYEGTVVIHNDNNLFNTQLNGFMPQVAAGVYFAQDRLELGISVENLNSPRLRFSRTQVDYSIRPRMNIYGEYRLDVQEGLALTPSLLIKSDLIQYQADISVLATINQKVFGGLSLRGYSRPTLDAIALMGGLQINKNLRVMYGTDLSLSGIKTSHQGTHELTLNYNLAKAIGAIEKEPIIYNPRY
jgi:type IX secretion system PorP/SprF family membrane protein